jgi:hypothetical protein
MHKTIIKGFAGALLAASLASCGSGLGTVSTGGTGGSTSIRLGSGTGSSFVSGTLALGSSSISAGGATSVTATIVDSTGTLYNQSVDVSFNSPCVSAGQATITDSAGNAGTVTASAGTAIATYTAKGCSGTDTITATATVNNQKLTATASVTVATAALGSIQFQSATPTVITLKGMGGAGLQETSTVIFAVKDSVGGAVQGATVTFALNTSVGGVALSANSAVSDANGNVQTIVQSGNFAGPVIVTASTVKSGTTISTQSSQLTINSGVPSQDHFSLSVETFNVEGGSIDGTKDTITASVADRFGNPVPDGTPISFIMSNHQFGAGGRVQGSCTTSSGTCSAIWTSQDPRPTTIANNQHAGYAYILAFTQGEESFTDQNGNGVFDKVGGVAEPFSDIGEQFAPSAEFAGGISTYLSGEPFYDFDNSGDYTDVSIPHKWEGVNCQAGTSCGSRHTTGVGGYVCLIMSTSGALITNYTGTGGAPGARTLAAPGAMTVDISDANGNPMPAGTTVTLQTGNLVGATATIAPNDGSDTYTWPNVGCSNSSGVVTFTITLTVATAPVSGNFTIQVTTPGNDTVAGTTTFSETITAQ